MWPPQTDSNILVLGGPRKLSQRPTPLRHILQVLYIHIFACSNLNKKSLFQRQIQEMLWTI